MKKTSVAAALGGVCLMLVPVTGAAAQTWVRGAEITGHAVQVETNGVVNTVNFDPGGSARIVSPSGQTVQGRWFIDNQQLCLETSQRECWPYQQAFQTGQQVVLTSSCAATSRWTPISTNQPMMQRRGERG